MNSSFRFTHSIVLISQFTEIALKGEEFINELSKHPCNASLESQDLVFQFLNMTKATYIQLQFHVYFFSEEDQPFQVWYMIPLSNDQDSCQSVYQASCKYEHASGQFLEVCPCVLRSLKCSFQLGLTCR